MVGVVVGCLTVFGLVGAAQAQVIHRGGHAYGVVLKHPAAPGLLNADGGTQVPLAYEGGPVMLSSHFYTIFWGPSGSFASSYTGTINQYLQDLQADSSLLTNDMSVSTQYCQGITIGETICPPEGSQNITTKDTFVASVNDTDPYPAPIGFCLTDTSGDPCVTDAQIQAEIKNEIALHGWETDPADAPVAQYLLFTPSGVDSCFDGGPCTFSTTGGFCGYHSEIQAADGGPNVAVYSNGPYEPGCDSGNVPGGVSGNADADGALDTLVHELNESATDPNPGTGWNDANGLEIGDKCENGPVDNDQPLGGSATASPPTLYNQVINSHDYYTQTLWSNAPTLTPASKVAAGCLQRLGPTPQITVPASVVANVPAPFDGSTSYDVADTISNYSWNFGDNTPAVTGAKVSHTYVAGGTYTVTLTVSDSAGNPTTQTTTVSVAPAKTEPLTVTPAGTGTGTVTSSPTGIDCGTSCSADFSTGSKVILTASPTNGSTFTGFAGAGCTGTAPCTVTMSAAKTVTATFASAVPESTLTVKQAGSGAGSGTVTSSPSGIDCTSLTCSADFDTGTKVTLTADPGLNTTFAGFSGGGCSGTGASCTVTLSASETVTATFDALVPPHTLTVTLVGTGTGTVTSSPAGINCGTTCSSLYDDGTMVTLTATAATGSAFTGFSVTPSTGGCTGTACSIDIKADETVTATFTAITGAATTLVANPYFYNLGPGITTYLTPSATLTSGDTPVSGQSITFTVDGQTICTATTTSTGLATCSPLYQGFFRVLFSGGYQANFAGSTSYQPATATGGLITINHKPSSLRPSQAWLQGHSPERLAGTAALA